MKISKYSKNESFDEKHGCLVVTLPSSILLSQSLLAASPPQILPIVIKYYRMKRGFPRPDAVGASGSNLVNSAPKLSCGRLRAASARAACPPPLLSLPLLLLLLLPSSPPAPLLLRPRLPRLRPPPPPPPLRWLDFSLRWKVLRSR